MRRGLLLAAAAGAIAVSRYALRARVPDDWDAIGFVRALDDFDLRKFQPHFPGYPVYVGLAKAAHLGLGALDAAAAVSAAAAAAAAIGVWWIARRAGADGAGVVGAGANGAGAVGAGVGGARANGAWGAGAALALFAAAALPWILGGAALSDETALAFALLAFAAIARPFLGAALVGLMLGARVSYWPLAVSWVAIFIFWGCEISQRRKFLPAREKDFSAGRGEGFFAAGDGRRFFFAALGGAVGIAVWLVPFVVAVGAKNLWALGRAHLAGHFTEWGGSIATRPGLLLRAGAFARDLAYDGIAPRGWALAAVALAAAFAIAIDRPRPRPSRRALAIALTATAPYALWTFFAQNLVEQPRHLLPLTAAATIALGLAVKGNRAVACLLPLLVMAASAPLAWAHAHERPAAAQAAEWAAKKFPGGDTAVFGARSVRFFEGALPAYPAGWLSEVDVALERLDTLPRHVLVTSELTVDPRRARRLEAGETFCRDPRLDRAQACLTLREYHIGVP